MRSGFVGVRYTTVFFEEERANVAKRTQARIATLLQQTDKSVDKATQTIVHMAKYM